MGRTVDGFVGQLFRKAATTGREDGNDSWSAATCRRFGLRRPDAAFSKKRLPSVVATGRRTPKEFVPMLLAYHVGYGDRLFPGLALPSDIILYQTDDGSTRLEVQLQDETVWLSQAQMAELFQTSVPNVSMHIRNVFLRARCRRWQLLRNP